ncbi:MAG: tRNA guanosine(34) transglycosylase Tgt [Candidatus Helarchaeota archaeon]
MFDFLLKEKTDDARCCIMKTPHGSVETPAFICVATKGTIRSLFAKDLEELGAQLLIVNAIHVFLKPSADIIKKAGGLHEYMAWKKPLITDSGGFQVISPQFGGVVKEEGIRFKSPYYPAKHHFITPEISMQMQADLGADIVMAFDECPAYGGANDRSYMESSLERTARWLKSCREYNIKNNGRQALFGIVQGGSFLDLRKKSLELTLNAGSLPGYALGGLSVGEPQDVRFKILKEITPLLPPEKPRYLMGVGTPEDILEGVEHGIDLFDSVYPTKIARHGSVFTHEGIKHIDSMNHYNDLGPIDPECNCFICQTYSLSYACHLFRDPATYLTGARMLIYHNLHFLLKLMQDIRESIRANTFREFKAEFLKSYKKRH